MKKTSLCFFNATDLAKKIREKEVSSLEIMEAHLSQIENVNPKVNNDDDGKDDVINENKKYAFVCPSNCIIKNTLITTKTRISEVVLSLS